jgi:hypothetical protein
MHFYRSYVEHFLDTGITSLEELSLHSTRR